MAKGHRTSTRRATAANATKAATDLICRLEDEAAQEVFGLGHLAELMEVWGDHVGQPGAGWSEMDTQEIGLRIEYLGGLVKRHAETIGKTVADMRDAAERLQRGAAQ